jgi:tRNA (guanine10-N2)-dimethyltransferase
MSMELLFELLKTIPPLPAGEAAACLEAEQIPYSITTTSDDIIVVTGDMSPHEISRLAARLSHTSILDRLLFTCHPDELIKTAQAHPLPTPGSFAVRVKNRSTQHQSEDIIDSLADVYSNSHPIKLQKPDHEIRAIVTDDLAYVGIKLAEIDTSVFETRKSQYRPFFTGITMHPRLARALVNLSRVRPGELFCDPFCGSGGILLEAGLIGMRLIGGDIEPKMTTGCTRSLDHYGLTGFQLFPTDIGRLPDYAPDVDGIATDFPYGRSTTTKGEDREQLYDRAFHAIAQLLKPGRYAVCGLADKTLIPLGEQYLSLQTVYDIRAHRSLTRSFAVFKKN